MSTSTPTTVALPRPYRRLLTSALHTRFVHASALVLLVCWNHAFFFSDMKSWCRHAHLPYKSNQLTCSQDFWSWFPLGPAGVRTIFIYFSALFVFILHVGTLKIGRRQTSSPFDTFRRILFSVSSIQPFFWYTVSALWFSEVFIWCSAEGANLGWIELGNLNTPDRLNERPIYLRGVCLILAVFQACFFLTTDLGTLKISIGSYTSASNSSKQETHPKLSAKEQFQRNSVSVFIYCAVVSAITSIMGPFIYSFTLRQWMWKFHLAFAKLFWNLSRANARATGYPPCNPSLILRSFGLGFLLLSLWMATSIFFGSLLDKEPLKKGSPLSAGSKDPNGTLLNGLKAKRDVVKTFAFWELGLIAGKQPDRRKAIFADIERPEGPCWVSMQEAALAVIRRIDDRIASTNPPPPPAPQSQDEIEKLPNIARPVSNKQIVLNPPKGATKTKKAEALIAAGAKMIGQSAHPWSPPVEKLAIELYDGARPHAQVISNEIQSTLTSEAFHGFFVRSRERKLSATVLGAPYSESVIIIDAVSSVTKLLVASLSEDAYGKVNKGVPEVVRAFTKTITILEKYARSFGPGIDESKIEDVLVVHAVLKGCLTELLSGFQMYLSDVGLGIMELNAAKSAAQKKPLIEPTPVTEKQREMTQPQSRAAVWGRPQRPKTGETQRPTAVSGGQRQPVQAVAQAKVQEKEKVRRPAQERLVAEAAGEDDKEMEDDELELPWSNPRRKLFDTVASPPSQNWLGNSMYNMDTRPRRGFAVDNPA